MFCLFITEPIRPERIWTATTLGILCSDRHANHRCIRRDGKRGETVVAQWGSATNGDRLSPVQFNCTDVFLSLEIKLYFGGPFACDASGLTLVDRRR
jgi:hypothetical protein